MKYGKGSLMSHCFHQVAIQNGDVTEFHRIMSEDYYVPHIYPSLNQVYRFNPNEIERILITSSVVFVTFNTTYNCESLKLVSIILQ